MFSKSGVSSAIVTDDGNPEGSVELNKMIDAIVRPNSTKEEFSNYH